jgi:Clathrin light chain
MADEDITYFAAPPGDDAPIVLGPPSDDPFAGGGDFGDFSAPPTSDYGGFSGGDDYVVSDDFARGGEFGGDEQAAYLGEINEMPMDAPIILAPSDDVPMEPEVEVEPTGPTPMQIWNEEWQETLKQRKDEENARKADLIEQSRLAMEQFHAERDQRREAAMAKNREDEQVKLEAIEADLENDNSWQRICKMIELSHDNSADSKDVKRMRDTLIHLKNDTTKATALSS